MAIFAIPLLFLILFTTPLFTAIGPPNSICPSFSCGDGLVIGYPFWQLGRKSSQCGYPNFGISCSGQLPMLQLSDHFYHIKTLNYSEDTLLVTYGDVNDTICPVASHGVTLNTTFSYLNFTTDDKIAHFFYNCTLYPPSIEKIKCLQLGASHSYVFMDGSVPEFDWKGNCDSTVTVPIMKKDRVDLLASTFGYFLQEGFKLTWQPDHICRSCESSGGFCGYGDGTNKMFTCFCSDGLHFANCHDKAEGVSERVGPNFLLIGGTIFGFLVTILMILYVSLKKRDGNHKQGFSRIETNGK